MPLMIILAPSHAEDSCLHTVQLPTHGVLLGHRRPDLPQPPPEVGQADVFYPTGTQFINRVTQDSAQNSVDRSERGERFTMVLLCVNSYPKRCLDPSDDKMCWEVFRPSSFLSAVREEFASLMRWKRNGLASRVGMTRSCSRMVASRSCSDCW